MNLNQVTLPATDLARSVEFYTRLGLVQIVDALPRYARFECPDGFATLSLHRVGSVDPESGFTIYLECSPLDRVVSELQTRGFAFESGPLDQRWLWREAHLRDPDGNRICLYEAGSNRRFPPWRIAAPGPAASQTRRAYERSAERYHDRFSTYEPYRQKILEFIDRVRPGGTVLDLGCGSGANARLMTDAGLRVKGYDYSEAMLELARRVCPAGVFELGDLRELPETGTFDAVLASFCIVHLLDGEAAAFLARLPTLMKPGGLLHVSFMEGREATWSTSSFSDEPLFYNYFDREWVAEILTGAGLELVRTATHDYPEKDGSTTTDVFLEFRSDRPPHPSHPPGTRSLSTPSRGERDTPSRDS